jgi:predicted hydrocarbon binding protein
MISSTHDLPLKGNYFAEGSYLTQDLGAGTLSNRAGARMLALSDTFLVTMLNTLEAELGEQAGSVVKDVGRDWGRRAAEQFASEMGDYFGRPLMLQPLAMFAANLTEAFRHHGWGNFCFDFSRYAQGVLVVEVAEPVIGAVVKPAAAPVESLLAAFLAGMFSHFAGQELECVQTDCRARGADRSRFVLTIPERLKAVAGKAHADVVAELTKN